MATIPQSAGTGSDIEKRLAKLESVIKVGADGGVTIECQGKVRIKSASSIEIDCAATVVVKGGASVDIQAGAQLNLKSSGMANLQGALLKLNNGSKPLARVGDTVTGSGGPGTIVAGATTVLA
jgi:hypothetical protein